jgi:hypothetical protein
LSHQPERKEKNCLNCGTTVIGRYCHVCGQENLETRESFWSLTKHFVFDILHFDGKFFHTLKYLVTRPGFVARQYCEGKRNSYLHPIRMYLFTSAVFFLIFFSVNKVNFVAKVSDNKMTTEERLDLVKDYRERLKENPNDTSIQKIIALLTDTTKQVSGDQIIALDPKPFFSITGTHYANRKEYDSVQRSLPSNKRDSWFRRIMVRKAMNFNEKYRERPGEASKIFIESFLHRLPYMLFLSLPFFALILKLLYIRRKNFYYSDHAIFTIYHYIFSFILLLILFGTGALRSQTGWGIFSFLIAIFIIIWPVYLLLEMKNFYRQGWPKTIGKFVLLNLLGLVVIFALFLCFLLFSVIEL